MRAVYGQVVHSRSTEQVFAPNAKSHVANGPLQGRAGRKTSLCPLAVPISLKVGGSPGGEGAKGRHGIFSVITKGATSGAPQGRSPRLIAYASALLELPGLREGCGHGVERFVRVLPSTLAIFRAGQKGPALL